MIASMPSALAGRVVTIAAKASGSVRRRVQLACHVRIEDRLRLDLLAAPSSSERYALDVLYDAGVELVEVVKVRPDSRAVFVVHHPVWGRCVLKTVLDTRYAVRAMANVAIAGVIEASGSRIFPAVHAADTAYTLERFIEGRPFHEWAATDLRLEAVSAYFDGLQAFGAGGTGKGRDGCLRPYEIRGITGSLIRKCLRQMRHRSAAQQIRGELQLARSSARQTSSIRRLADESERLMLPRGLMCGDMSSDNILVQEAPIQMVNIDVERLSPGHWGFDAAYFLARLWAEDLPLETLRAVRTEALTQERFGDADVFGFFSTLTDVLSEICGTVHGVNRPRRWESGCSSAASVRSARAPSPHSRQADPAGRK